MVRAMHDVVRAGCLLAGRYRLDTHRPRRIIVPGTFDGAADARWRFGYRQAAGRVVVLDLLVRLATSAGEQSYALSMSAPRPEAAAAAEFFRQLLQTFRPAP
jgi:hypothetical protein